MDEEQSSPIHDFIVGIFDYTVIVDNYMTFVVGVGNTISLVALSLLFGGLLAVPLAVLRAERHPIFSPLIWSYTYVFRGTPLLIQTFLIYYGLGQFEVVRESFAWPVLREAYWCALIAFALNSAAYTTEIIRGAIEATPHGEVEAARAMGMSKTKVMRRIVLPSAFRRALPAYSNEVIFMLHGSVVASTVTVIDILGAGRTVNGKYYIYLEGFLTAAILYMILVYIISRGVQALEKAWYKHLRPRVEATQVAVETQ
jgi:arginine/ornithine transport system permease protein